MIDGSALQLLLRAVLGWLDRREREAMAYLIEENRLLRRQIGVQRLRLTDDDRRRLAVRAYRLGREALRDDRRDVREDPSAETFTDEGEPPTFVVAQPYTPAIQLRLQYAVLFP